MEEKKEESKVVTTTEQEPITRAILCFARDKEDRNWVSKLANGKWAILHRNSTWIPQPNVLYMCSVEEKSSHAICWITGYAHYPRIVVRGDRSCVYVEDPSKITTKKQKIYSDIYTALEDNPDLETIFLIYRKENKEQDKSTKKLKTVKLDLKLADTSGITLTDLEIPFTVPADYTPQDIINTIKKWMSK